MHRLSFAGRLSRPARRALVAAVAVIAVGGVAASGATAASRMTPAAAAVTGGPEPQIELLPDVPGLVTSTATPSTACELPDGTYISYFHCYTPQDIRAAYGVDNVAPIGSAPNYGQGQTIVLVENYGSPTAAADLQHFHDTFFPSLPNPDFKEIYPLGNPQYQTCNGNGNAHSGPCQAMTWSVESSLDIEWAYSIAPEANLILLAVPSTASWETLFQGISDEITALPSGTEFSMSWGGSEQGLVAARIAKFDAVFQQGLAKDDNFFVSSGDYGSDGSKQSGPAAPTLEWPASSPYVVSVGGTQLQYGWTWDPASDDAFTSTGDFNPAYWQSIAGGDSQAVWNESFGGGSGGGASAVYPRPSWQAGVDPGLGNARLVPDTSWDAADNGGVEVYETAYPGYYGTTDDWFVAGGTSAAAPQTAALVALANAARAAASKAPIGFLDPILYSGVGASASAYSDIVPMHYGSAAATFAGSEVGVSGTVDKSVGDLVDNQLWQLPVAGYQTTSGYDTTTGWGTPNAPGFVAALESQP